MWEKRGKYLVDLSYVKKNERGNNWQNSIGHVIMIKSDTEEKTFVIADYERKGKHKRTIHLTLEDCTTRKQYPIRTMDILHGKLDKLFK